MKKTIVFILSLLLIVTSFGYADVRAQYYTYEEEEINYRVYDGTSSIESVGFIQVPEQDRAKVRYNILNFDNKDDNIHLVTISNYFDFAWGMSPLTGMINKFQQENPNLEVLGGINGDFYDINHTGFPSSTFIEDYEVIKGATSSSRSVFNIRADGTYDFGKPKRLGYEVLVKDENNEIKFRELVDSFNVETTNENHLAVFTDRFEGLLNNIINPVTINATDIKYTGNQGAKTNFEFAKGNAKLDFEAETITEKQFIVAGKSFESIVSETDVVIVQHKLEGYENVRGTMGGSLMLVDNGEVGQDVESQTGFNRLARHPRTTVGIREDGSVFFLQTNGRDDTEGVLGTSYRELAYLLQRHGAKQALNLDGGGSSTMIVKNEDGEYEVLNKLSDGRIRSVSNGILIVRGDVPEQPIHIKDEDNRVAYNTPSNIYIDHNYNLNFDPVENATRYIVSINGYEYETSKTEFSLNFLEPKNYTITVKTKSNLYGKTSEESIPLSYQSQKFTTKQLLDWLKDYAKNNN